MMPKPVPDPRNVPKNAANKPPSPPASVRPPNPSSGIGLTRSPFEGAELGPEPVVGSKFLRALKQMVLFWQPARDVIHVSVFAPAAVTPGQNMKVVVSLHTPGSADSVRTLVRAFQSDAELVGTGFVSKEIARGSELAVHLSVAHAGLSKSLLTFVWKGQPHRLQFDVHVPWEAPGGATQSIVSIGQQNQLIGKTEAHINVLPRKG